MLPATGGADVASDIAMAGLSLIFILGTTGPIPCVAAAFFILGTTGPIPCVTAA